MKKSVEAIIKQEWQWFDQVNNIGGRASCQDDGQTFYIMRGSQLSAWSGEMLESYREDIVRAKQQGVNLVEVKYGYMMASTDPEAYARIADRLPARGGKKKAMVEAICLIHVQWLQALSQKYPGLTGRGRLVCTGEDRPGITSFETYLRGELGTYSLKTLQYYKSYIDWLVAQGKNLNAMILTNEIQMVGFSSLEEAENRVMQSREKS
jgi:hypothetical protein